MQARIRSALSPPFGNRVQLSQNRDGPTKSVRTGRSGVADGATRTTFWADHQLGARAESLPFHRRLRGVGPVPGTEFTGKSPEVFGIIRRDVDGHPSQPGCLRRQLVGGAKGEAGDVFVGHDWGMLTEDG